MVLFREWILNSLLPNPSPDPWLIPSYYATFLMERNHIHYMKYLLEYIKKKVINLGHQNDESEVLILVSQMNVCIDQNNN